ncbi:MAG: glutathione ABC transporter permease GsiD [Firmicutes bacterium HGW-Firmicutes-16]|nr:MAG: glutathione ABC transporter permease GsiD [Firmicutes bacterium HGW-Firmicutes-16]
MKNNLNKVIDFLNRKNVMLFVGGACCTILILVTILAPILELHDPTEMNLSASFMAPCANYPFGTDNLGRCIYSRVIEGSRISLTTASIVVILSAAIGTVVGLIFGYSGGITDAVVMRIVDIFLAFPTIVFALAVSTVLGTGQKNLIIAICCIQWTRYARMARGEVVLLKNAEYIEAAKAMGNNKFQIIFKYLLPNVASKILILMSLDIGSIILYCASLSFLGLGAQPPSPDWGAMISDGKDYLRFSPWMSLFPGLSIAFSALSFNMLGDGLRDLIDPRMRESVNPE